MPRLRQINVRISEEAHRALVAAVFVRDLRSPQEILGPAVEEVARELMQDKAIAQAVNLRASHMEEEFLRRSSAENVAPPRLRPVE